MISLKQYLNETYSQKLKLKQNMKGLMQFQLLSMI